MYIAQSISSASASFVRKSIATAATAIFLSAACGSVHAAKIFPLVVNKSFSPSTATIDGTSEMAVTITNPNGFGVYDINFSDKYPVGLSNGLFSFARPSNTCGGMISAQPGLGLTSLSGGTLQPNASCTVTVNVQSNQSGQMLNDTGPVSGFYGNGMTLPVGKTGTATLVATGTVVDPPMVTKTFEPEVIQIFGVSQLTITLSNPNSIPLNGVQFDDGYPSDMENDQVNVIANNTCGGTVSASPAGRSLGLHNVTIPAFSTCQVTANVVGTNLGWLQNETGPVLSANGKTSGGAMATLHVVP